jgi:hypothetical protein
MAPDAIDAYTAATGHAAELVLHATNEEIMGKLIASGGAGYDVVFVSSPFAEVLNNLGLAETLDHAKIPNIANLYPEAQALEHDPGNTFSLPYAWGTTGLCYRSDLVAEAPDSVGRSAHPVRGRHGQDHDAGDRPLASGGRVPGQRYVGERDRPRHARQGARRSDRRRSARFWPMTTPPSTPSSSRARRRWSTPGTAGATTASPRMPISNTSSPRKAATSGSTRW